LISFANAFYYARSAWPSELRPQTRATKDVQVNSESCLLKSLICLFESQCKIAMVRLEKWSTIRCSCELFFILGNELLGWVLL